MLANASLLLFYKSYHSGIETEKNEVRYCRISGMKTKLFSVGRDNSLMPGSDIFIITKPTNPSDFKNPTGLKKRLNEQLFNQ